MVLIGRCRHVEGEESLRGRRENAAYRVWREPLMKSATAARSRWRKDPVTESECTARYFGRELSRKNWQYSSLPDDTIERAKVVPLDIKRRTSLCPPSEFRRSELIR